MWVLLVHQHRALLCVLQHRTKNFGTPSKFSPRWKKTRYFQILISGVLDTWSCSSTPATFVRDCSFHTYLKKRKKKRKNTDESVGSAVPSQSPRVFDMMKNWNGGSARRVISVPFRFFWVRCVRNACKWFQPRKGTCKLHLTLQWRIAHVTRS